MKRRLAEYLTGQAAEWRHRGLIDDELAGMLRDRYAVDASLARVLLRWLGFIALFLLGSSVLGLVSMSLAETAAYLVPVAIGAAAWLAWHQGVRLATEPAQRHATSGVVLVTIGLFAGFVAVAMLYWVLGGRDPAHALPAITLIAAGAALVTAYRHGLRWPLLLGVLLAFHALGNTHEYLGNGGYYFGIWDERMTLVIALVVLAFGLWHEHVLERSDDRREVGFGHVYILTGLFYANVCLWLLSIPHGDPGVVAVFAAAGVAWIVAGAGLHDARFTGFGIVFLSINLFTRLFEGFRDKFTLGGLLLLAGILAMIIGVALELRARALREGAGA